MLPRKEVDKLSSRRRISYKNILKHGKQKMGGLHSYFQRELEAIE